MHVEGYNMHVEVEGKETAVPLDSDSGCSQSQGGTKSESDNADSLANTPFRFWQQPIISRKTGCPGR